MIRGTDHGQARNVLAGYAAEIHLEERRRRRHRSWPDNAASIRTAQAARPLASLARSPRGGPPAAATARYQPATSRTACHPSRRSPVCVRRPRRPSHAPVQRDAATCRNHPARPAPGPEQDGAVAVARHDETPIPRDCHPLDGAVLGRVLVGDTRALACANRLDAAATRDREQPLPAASKASALTVPIASACSFSATARRATATAIRSP